jgi:OFA family oxalate/formate antiporter-like MFS transporter
VNYGLLFTAWGVAGLIGPRIGGRMFDIYGNYQYAFYTGAVICLVALGFEMLARRPAETRMEPAKAAA